MRKVLVVLVAALVVTTANAALVTLTETFESYPLGNLYGNDGWTAHSGTTANIIQIISDNGPTFPGEKAVLLNMPGSGQDVNVALGTTMAAGDLWYYAFDMKTTTNDTTYFAHFRTGTSFGPRLDLQASGSGFNFGFEGISTYSAVYETNVRNVGQWYRVVCGYDFNTGTEYLWVNPAPGDVGTPIVTGTIFASNAFTSFALRQNTSTAQITIDNIVVSSNFAEAATPEPTSVMLLGLGIAGLLRRR